MDKNTNNKKWWLYGALGSFIIAIAGVLLWFFVFNGGKKHHIDDDDEDEDEDDIELVDDKKQATDDQWDDLDDWGEEIVISDSIQPIDITPTDDELPSSGDQNIYDLVEQKPEFLEGDLPVWLGSHIQYPPESMNNGVVGTVVCQFVVEKDGSIGNVTVLRSVDPLLDKEAVRVIESMPKWAPGKKDGEPVRVKYTIPIKFQL